MRPAMYLAIVFAVINFVNALPLPELDDGNREVRAPRDTVYYGLPFSWYRPFYGDDNDGIVNEGEIVNSKRRSSTISYVNVGSAWGR